MLSVSGGFVAVIDDWLCRAGYGASPLCFAIRRIRPDQSVDIPTVDGFLKEAVEISGERFAPLMIGQSIGRQHLGAIGHMLASSQTLEDMLNAYVFYESLFYGVNIANVRRSVKGMELYWSVGSVPEHYACFAMSSFVAITRLVGIRNNAVASVSFPFDDKQYQQCYCKEMGVNDVVFGRDLGLLFHRDALQLTLQTEAGNPKVELIKEILPEIAHLDFVTQLYDEVVSALPHKQATLKSIARKMVVSERTLQRRLQHSDDGLRGVVSRIRMHLARRYLQDKGMNLVAVSLLLGYSEQSAFQLAFKRYHGMSPGKWRKDNIEC